MFMLFNYLKLAFRNLTKRKGYSLLNIAGLAIGITCCLLIFQYVAYERSFDSFEDKAKQIVRLRLDSYQQGKLSWRSATIYPAFGPTMKKDFPEVEEFCRLVDADLLLSNDEKQIKFSELKGYFADPSFLPLFNVQLTKGNPRQLLRDPINFYYRKAWQKNILVVTSPWEKGLCSVIRRIQGLLKSPVYSKSFLRTLILLSIILFLILHLAAFCASKAILPMQQKRVGVGMTSILISS
jgi:putative ABC transport system permease protein